MVSRRIIATLLLACVIKENANAFQSSVSGIATLRKGIGGRINGHVQTTKTRRRAPSSCSPQEPLGFKQERHHTLTRMHEWDGDDIRWTTRFRRSLSRRNIILDTSIRSKAKFALIALQILMYGYQILTTVVYFYRKYPSYWSTNAVEMIADSVWGSGVAGPLTTTFGFSAALFRQSYRYITSGFFHDGLFHLLVDIGVMSTQPSWLASDLGGPLYLTTFLGSVIFGNFAHLMNTPDRVFDANVFVGANGGICGLFGLMFVCLFRMSNANPSKGGVASGQLARGMGIMILLSMFMENISTATNIGGFVGGALIGIVCGPRYNKSYSMRRKNSVGYDSVSRDYRSTMGFGIMPTKGGMVPLGVLYSVLLAVILVVPRYRNIPFAIIQGFATSIS